MYRILYENFSGEKIELKNEAPYFFLSQTGFDGSEASAVLTKAPYQKGKTFLFSDIDQRIISLRGCLVTETDEQYHLCRKHLLSVFNPLINGNLYVYNTSGEKVFRNVSVVSAPKFEDKDYQLPDGIVYFTITMVCASNFIEDKEEKEIGLFQVVPLFKFPLSFDQTIEFGTLSGGRVNIYNSGDVETPIEVHIPGYVKTPYIKNETTGEFIEVKIPIEIDEVMKINTSFGKKSVVIENSAGLVRNAFNYIDINSTFFSLQKGTNIVHFNAEEGNDYALIKIKYRIKYLGI